MVKIAKPTFVWMVKPPRPALARIYENREVGLVALMVQGESVNYTHICQNLSDAKTLHDRLFEPGPSEPERIWETTNNWPTLLLDMLGGRSAEMTEEELIEAAMNQIEQ